jgi:hypothetical protein
MFQISENPEFGSLSLSTLRQCVHIKQEPSRGRTFMPSSPCPPSVYATSSVRQSKGPASEDRPGRFPLTLGKERKGGKKKETMNKRVRYKRQDVGHEKSQGSSVTCCCNHHHLPT